MSFMQINKWAVPGPTTASQVRSLRKVNNDQVAIAIDMDHGGNSRLEDEDDDKGTALVFTFLCLCSFCQSSQLII